MFILIRKKNVKEAQKLGFKPEEVTPGVYGVEVEPKDPIAYLRSKKAEKEGENVRENEKKLMRDRVDKADEEFEAYDFDEEGANIIECDRWETDGPNRLIGTIYWEPKDEEVDDSNMGSFIVDFKKGSAEVVEVYANL